VKVQAKFHIEGLAVNSAAVEGIAAMHVVESRAGLGLGRLHELGRAGPAIYSGAGRQCSLGGGYLPETGEELLGCFATGWILEWRMDVGRPLQWTS
jgi:hypothetical protein